MTGTGAPYSFGVRSSVVTVVMRVTRHFAAVALHLEPVRQVPKRRDVLRHRARRDRLVYTTAVASDEVTVSTAVPSTDVLFVTCACLLVATMESMYLR